MRARSVADSAEKVRTPLPMASSSSPSVLPGPVYRQSAAAYPAARAAASSPVELISARHALPGASRSAPATSGCGLAFSA